MNRADFEKVPFVKESLEAQKKDIAFDALSNSYENRHGLDYDTCELNGAWQMYQHLHAEIDNLKAASHGAEIGHSNFVKQLKKRHANEIDKLNRINNGL